MAGIDDVIHYGLPGHFGPRRDDAALDWLLRRVEDGLVVLVHPPGRQPFKPVLRWEENPRAPEARTRPGISRFHTGFYERENIPLQAILSGFALDYATLGRARFLNGEPLDDARKEFAKAACHHLKVFTMAYDETDPDYQGEKSDLSRLSEVEAIDAMNYALMGPISGWPRNSPAGIGLGRTATCWASTSTATPTPWPSPSETVSTTPARCSRLNSRTTRRNRPRAPRQELPHPGHCTHRHR